MTNVICGWCYKSFDTPTARETSGYGTHRCPNCGRLVRSSKKELVEGVNAVKHFVHSALEAGDFV